MTLAQVKQYLGIPTATTTFDSDITAYIPIVEATARQITGGLYLMQVNGTITSGSNELLVKTVYSQTRQLYGYTVGNGKFFDYGNPGAKPRKMYEILKPGMQISADGIPTGAYVDRVQSFGNESKVFLSANATKSHDVEAYTDFPINLLSTIAHGVWWMIGQQKTAANDTAWTSRSVGPVSVSRGEAEMKIDGQYGMPAWFVKAFPRVYQC
jgi:hypothetical protein